MNWAVGVLAVYGAGLLAAGCSPGGSDALVLATTTSVEDSGLLPHLLATHSQEASRPSIRTLAVGSGEALELGRRRDADLLIVHHPEAEAAFVADGYGEARVPFMFNDFAIVGPSADPADVSSARSVSDAFRRIANSRVPFVSRGDRSGTHGRELAVWRSAGVMPEGSWYLEAGQGMGAVLQMASERQAYTLSDRSTFLSMESHLDLAILHEGDPRLRNVYSVIVVLGSGRESAARAVRDWLTGPAGRLAIDDYRDGYGRQLFRSLEPGGAPAPEIVRNRADMRTRGSSATAGQGAEPAGATGLERVTAGGPARPGLAARLLCRSLPPAHADPGCRRTGGPSSR